MTSNAAELSGSPRRHTHTQPLCKRHDLGPHHLLLLSTKRQQLVQRVDGKQVALAIHLGIEHPDEPVTQENWMSEEAILALRLRLELLEYVLELEDLLQARAVEQHSVVRIEKRHAAARVI